MLTVISKCQAPMFLDAPSPNASYTDARCESLRTCTSPMCDSTGTEVHIQSRHHSHARADDDHLQQVVCVEEFHQSMVTTDDFLSECQSKSASRAAAEVCNHDGSNDHSSTSTESAPSGNFEEHSDRECQIYAQKLFARAASSAHSKGDATFTADDATLASNVCVDATICGGSGSNSLSYIARLESELHLMQVKLMKSEKAREELILRLTHDHACLFGVYDISGADGLGPKANLDELYLSKTNMHLLDCSQDSRQRARGKTKSHFSRLFRIPLPFSRLRRKTSRSSMRTNVSARSPGQSIV